jgi:hypothetical protein
MGVVYKAHQVHMDRWVALKVLPKRLVGDVASVQRFYREMKAATRVEHPNTVRIYDFGHTEDGELFLAMELLQGETLLELINREAPLPPKRIVHIGRQIAKALGAAHAAGIVHRDLKPENVFVLQLYGELDHVKVLDFGVARLDSGVDDGTPTLTTTGQVVGTPYYMAPEQAMGKPAEPRSDLYSLGVVLYRMATGVVPFRESTPVMVLYQHVHSAPIPPRELHPECVPQALEDVILTLLEKRVDDRPPTAEAAIGLLDSAVTGEFGTISSPVLGEATSRGPRQASSARLSVLTSLPAQQSASTIQGLGALPAPSRMRWLLAGAAVSAVAVAAVWWFARSGGGPSDPTPTQPQAAAAPALAMAAPAAAAPALGGQPPAGAPTPAQIHAVSPQTAKILPPGSPPAAPGGGADGGGGPAQLDAILAQQPPAAPPSPAGVPATALPPAVPTPQPGGPTAAAATAGEAAPPAVAPGPPAPSAVEQPPFTVRVTSEPSGASVWVAGETVGVTPLDLPVPRSTPRGAVEVRLAGHNPVSRSFDAELERTLNLVLTAESNKPKATATGPKRLTSPSATPGPGAASAPSPNSAPGPTGPAKVDRWDSDSPSGPGAAPNAPGSSKRWD